MVTYRRSILAIVAMIVALVAAAFALVAAHGGGVSQPLWWDHMTGQVKATFEPADEAPPLEKIVHDAEEFSADKLLPIEPKTAKEINAARPFSKLAITPAAPFNSRLAGADRERAATCLAVAALYEAGGSADDQRPVMQVVLNRVRHPAWPNTVCGVVFQGAERSTGCQFSFTCDGSMQRWRPSAAAYLRARALAEAMLGKEIDSRVGWATHYHTDWVVPYWSESLEKLTAVKTHLFFRWKGVWGTGPAFDTVAALAEPPIRQLAALDPLHAGTALVDGEEELGVNPAILAELGLEEQSPSQGAASPPEPIFAKPIVQVLATGTTPGRWALDAVAACAGNSECRVVGWAPDSERPWELDSDGLSSQPPDLIYVQTLKNRTQQVYWNCAKWQRAGTARCIAGGQQAVNLALVPL